MSKSASDKSAHDNRANQLNPHHPTYHQSRGEPPQRAEDLARQSQEADRASGPNPPTDKSPKGPSR